MIMLVINRDITKINRGQREITNGAAVVTQQLCHTSD
jgi:hypothetical protein